MTSYPPSITPKGHTAPVPRRVRAQKDGRCVVEHDQRGLRVGAREVPAVLPAGRGRGCGIARRPGVQAPAAPRPGPARPRADPVGCAGPLVRGGGRGVRAPTQPVHTGGRAALEPARPHRARAQWCSPSHRSAGAGVRDRAPTALLPRPQLPGPRSPRAVANTRPPAPTRAGPPRTGRPGSAMPCTRTSPGATTPLGSSCRSPGWSRSTTRRSTPSSTASGRSGRSPRSAEPHAREAATIELITPGKDSSRSARRSLWWV